jgi:hypothetical protein
VQSRARIAVCVWQCPYLFWGQSDLENEAGEQFEHFFSSLKQHSTVRSSEAAMGIEDVECCPRINLHQRSIQR